MREGTYETEFFRAAMGCSGSMVIACSIIILDSVSSMENLSLTKPAARVWLPAAGFVYDDQ